MSKDNDRPRADGEGDVPRAVETRNAAWEMIAAGRYQPRRIRGSFPGRELG